MQSSNVAYIKNDVIINSNKNFLKERNTKRFMSDALNRLMSELSAMEEFDDFVIKKEPMELIEINEHQINRDVKCKKITKTLNTFPMEITVKDGTFPVEAQILSNVKVKEERIETENIIPTNVNLKEEPEQPVDMRDDSFNVPEKDKNEFHFMAETIVKQEQEDLDYDYLNCLEDFENKSLRVMLTKFKCFMCDHCPVFYNKKRDLIKHINTEHYLMFRNHNNVTKSFHYCTVCEKKLPYKRWSEHISIVHSIQKCICEFCGKVFKHPRYLKRHEMYVHGNIRPPWRFSDVTSNNKKVNCPLCSKVFANKNSLRTHTKTCHSEKSYTCKLCNSTLKCKTYLNAHMRRVHYDDGRRHTCDICHKQYKSPRYLKVHKKNSHYSL